uniref:Glycosyltransferase family 32 protein n=1 Tax=Macrostomum lignano TaxID=282301 RepID=A0A1I8HSL2_9PLAT
MNKLLTVLTAGLSIATLFSILCFHGKLRCTPEELTTAVQHDGLEPPIMMRPAAIDSHVSDSRNDSTANKFIYLSVRLPSVCSVETCRADYVRHLRQVGDAFPIPKIRHILWKSKLVSGYFAEQLLSWKRIHPDWTYVLWRDEDLEPFVATQFPGLLGKYKSLQHHIMRVDMIRYMLLFKFGGVYADLDYTLVRSIDQFRRFHAVVTREPDPHSLQFLGMHWPVKPLASPAFLMSTPGHAFLHSVMQQLESRAPTQFSVAGPFGLTEFLERYQRIFPVANHPLETVYIPPAHSFYPYDRNQPVYAVHDLKKTGSIWYGAGTKFYNDNLTDCSKIFQRFVLGPELYKS